MVNAYPPLLGPPPPFSYEIYSTLKRFYDAPDAPLDCLSIEGIEGFLCAIASGPPFFDASRWVRCCVAPSQLKDEIDVPMTLKESHRQTMCLISWLHHIAGRLASPCATRGLQHLSGKELDSAILWCDGYLVGVNLNWEFWEPVVKKHPVWFEPIFTLAAQLSSDAPSLEDLQALAEQLPRKVLYIYRHALAQWRREMEQWKDERPSPRRRPAQFQTRSML